MAKTLYAGFERFELGMTMAQAQSGSHQGRCDDDVAVLCEVPEIAAQLDAFGAEKIAAELKGYGAWDAEELADHTQNRARLVWCAACNIAEGEFLEEQA